MSLFFLFVLGTSNVQRGDTFGFYPIIITGPNGQAIHNFFDLNHLDSKASHASILKKIIYELKHYQNIEKNIEKLEQLMALKNGNAAFILGTIYEFGLFNKEMNDKLALQYYQLGSRFNSYECKSSLAFFYHYEIAGLDVDLNKSKDLTQETMNRCVYSALRMATMLHDNNQTEKALSILFPLAQLVVSNSTIFDFMDISAREIKKFDGRSLPSGSGSEYTQYLESLGHNGDTKAKIKILLSALSNRDYEKAIEIVGEDYKKIERALMTAKTGEGKNLVDRKYGFYYSIFAMMKKYGIEICQKEENNKLHLNHENHSLTIGNLFQKALQIGDPIAYTEFARIYLQRRSEEAQSIGKSLLLEAVNASYVPAMHEYGVMLMNGHPPFRKDVETATKYFLECYTGNKYLPSMLSLAQLRYKNDPDEAYFLLKELIERSFLFKEAVNAYIATLDGNYPKSLHIYRRLADGGSNNASFNVVQLFKNKGASLIDHSIVKYGLDGSNHIVEYSPRYVTERIKNLTKRWLFSSPDAYYELAEDLLHEEKNKERAIEYYKKAAKENGFASFKAGWLLMHESPGEALTYLDRAKILKKEFGFAILCLKGIIYIENLPDLFQNAQRFNQILFDQKNAEPISELEAFLARNTIFCFNVLSLVVTFITLYLFLVLRFGLNR